MTDRELLKLAAKAAGIQLFELDEYEDVLADGTPWKPLADDGEALRLAVKLEIQAGYTEFSGSGLASWARGTCSLQEYGPDDPCAATRRAIVRAAAEIGNAMP